MQPDSLNHYRILRAIGAGGMGEVYLAEDTTLHRKVALKVLLDESAADPERRERFRREARAIAALSHPNIVTIHSVEEDRGRLFLTMEHVDGKALTDLIPRGGLPLEKLLAIAIPLSDAVASAHQRGIVHRDLKPANVMLSDDGRVKVLDFGLATLRPEAVGRDDTMTAPVTGEGRVLGTAAYMAPEQAEARPVDARSDLFSLGVVLYEMATGERPFKGDSTASLVSAILRDTPQSVSALRPDVPRELARIIKRCLQKDPEQRYQTAKDLRNDLQLLKSEIDSGELTAANPGTVSRRRPRAPGALWAAVGGLIVVALAAAIVAYRELRPAPAATRPFARFDVRKLTTDGNVGTSALSPDGTYVAYTVCDEGGQTLRMRQLVTGADTVIVPRQSTAYVGLTFSPDAQYIYYVTATEAASGLYAYFIQPVHGRLYRLPSLGGSPTEVLDNVDGMVSLSPDGRRVVFYRSDRERGETALITSNVDGTSLNTIAVRKEPQTFVATGPVWSPDGRMIAAPFEGPDGASVSIVPASGGPEVAPPLHATWGMIQQITWAPDSSGIFLTAAHASSAWLFQIWFAPYPTGVPSRITNDANNYFGLSASRAGRSLVVLDSEWPTGLWVGPLGRAGGISHAGSPGDGFFGVTWSPDGRIVFGTRDFDIGVCDADGGNRRILTVDEHNNRWPVVTKDGRHVFFRSWRHFGNMPLWRMNLDGGDARAVTGHPGGERPALSPDGKWVLHISFGAAGHRPTVWRVGAEGGKSERVTDLISTVAVSPDGRLLAGPRSAAGARPTVAVLPFGGGDPVMTFDAAPGVSEVGPVRWMADGRSVVYSATVNGVSNIWSQSLSGGAPTKLTDFREDYIQDFDIGPGGRAVFGRLHVTQNILQITTAR